MSADRARQNYDIVKRRRIECRDFSVGRHGLDKTARVDLGIELLMLRARRGVALSQDDMAVWLGCTPAAVYAMERRALKAIANKLRFADDCRLFAELLEERALK